MRWMMWRWWCEGGGDRAWWLIESVFLRSPNKGFWACLGDLPPDMPKRPETWVSLCNLMLKLRGISRSSSRIAPRVTIGRVTPSIPCERPNVIKHAIAGYLRLSWPTPAPALMRELHWHRSWAEEPGYVTGNPPEGYGQIRGGSAASIGWLLPNSPSVPCQTACNWRNRSLMTLPGWGRKATLLPIITVPPLLEKWARTLSWPAEDNL